MSTATIQHAVHADGIWKIFNEGQPNEVTALQDVHLTVESGEFISLIGPSGCGKSTFMRRMTSLFGGKASPPEGGNPDSNTLISDTTTVLCLDDYHLNDRQGRKESGLTALNLAEQDFGACAIPTVETNPDPTRIALQRLRPRSRGPDRDS